MNANKVTVPSAVAAAIRHYTDLADTKTEALTDILRFGFETEKSEIILRHFDGNHDELMEALICGYEVEKSPEEKVRELYDALKADRDDYFGISVTMHARYDLAVHAVKKSLDFLGIYIDGVNAK